MDTPPVLESLEDDAKAVCAAWFGMMPPGEGFLSFAMKEQKPSQRAQKALDRLVEVGVIERNGSVDGPHSYTPLIECRGLLSWLLENDDGRFSFPLTEKISSDKKGGMTLSFRKSGDEMSDRALSETLDILKDEYGR